MIAGIDKDFVFAKGVENKKVENIVKYSSALLKARKPVLVESCEGGITLIHCFIGGGGLKRHFISNSYYTDEEIANL